MKKIFIALSVLAALTFGVGSALAVPGVPDSVPGCDFTVPFLVSDARVTGGSGQTTVLNLSEVKGYAEEFHVFFYTTTSVYVADAWLPITHWGTVMKDIATFIINMSDSDRAALSVTFEGESYYAGYIVGQNNVWRPSPTPPYPLTRYRGIWNNVIGSIYLLDLSEGKAGASNLPMREYFALSGVAYPNNITTNPDLPIYQNYWTQWAITGSNPNLTAAKLMPTAFGSYERFSAVAHHAANARVWGLPVDVAPYGSSVAPLAFPTTWWAPTCGESVFYPEYYILDSTGATYFILWQNGLPNGTRFHMFVINAAEDYLSTTIPINEVTFINAIDWIPTGLLVAYPYHGIFNWTTDDTTATTTQLTWFDFLGWSWQRADNGAASAATNWTILKQIARDVGTQGTWAAQPTHVTVAP